MLRKHTTITHKLIPLFIYDALPANIAEVPFIGSSGRPIIQPVANFLDSLIMPYREVEKKAIR